MTVSIVAEGPSFHITDETAAQMVAARREAKEEQDSAPAETESSEIIADSRVRVYYAAGCTPAQEINVKDRVMFKTKEEAEKAGYKPASECP
jgi:hypothetical protein